MLHGRLVESTSIHKSASTTSNTNNKNDNKNERIKMQAIYEYWWPKWREYEKASGFNSSIFHDRAGVTEYHGLHVIPFPFPAIEQWMKWVATLSKLITMYVDVRAIILGAKKKIERKKRKEKSWKWRREWMTCLQLKAELPAKQSFWVYHSVQVLLFHPSSCKMAIIKDRTFIWNFVTMVSLAKTLVNLLLFEKIKRCCYWQRAGGARLSFNFNCEKEQWPISANSSVDRWTLHAIRLSWNMLRLT